MRHISKFVLRILLAVVVLGLVAGAASGHRIALNGTAFVIVFGSGSQEGHVICPFTLEGTFHSRTFSKVSGGLVGYITRAIVGERLCTGGSARFLAERLPWHIRYDSFTGTLPAITSIHFQIIGLAVLFLQRILGVETSCLYLTSASSPARFIFGREAGGVINVFRWDETAFIPSQNGFPCERTSLQGSVPENENPITATLVA